RVNSLSDAEVVRLAEQIEQLPAGANGGVDVVTIVIVAAFILCMTLFIIGIIEMLW
ncbi:MAG: hypothetical protein JRJ47_12285, partial [Deltaproteobacteria bacterium]|nr:hypothetical protein [Deltaproteobacteria bacterium]